MKVLLHLWLRILTFSLTLFQIGSTHTSFVLLDKTNHCKITCSFIILSVYNYQIRLRKVGI